MLVAVFWPVVFLPSNPVARVRFPAESGILVSVLLLNTCALSSVFVVSGGGPEIVLSTHSGRPALVYLSSVLVHSLIPVTTKIYILEKISIEIMDPKIHVLITVKAFINNPKKFQPPTINSS